MFGRKRNREAHRYYLLPGMGRSNRRHRRKVHVAAIVFGAVISLLFGVALYWLQSR
jgi:high-affinity Fe2+/Pb2+ permease